MTTSPESDHAEPTSPVSWVRKHLAHELGQIIEFCERRGIDEAGRVALQGVYEKAIEELDNLPSDLPLNQALETIYFGARDNRDAILAPPQPPA